MALSLLWAPHLASNQHEIRKLGGYGVAVALTPCLPSAGPTSCIKSTRDKTWGGFLSLCRSLPFAGPTSCTESPRDMKVGWEVVELVLSLSLSLLRAPHLLWKHELGKFGGKVLGSLSLPGAFVTSVMRPLSTFSCNESDQDLFTLELQPILALHNQIAPTLFLIPCSSVLNQSSASHPCANLRPLCSEGPKDPLSCSNSLLADQLVHPGIPDPCPGHQVRILPGHLLPE